MSLSDDLDTLRQQRNAEIHTLHLTYLRTKRTVLRTASPSRIIRQHMGAALATAAALGLLIAPAPAASTPKSAPAKSSRLPWLKKIVTHFYPKAAQFIPDSPSPSTAETPPSDSSSPTPHKKHHLLRTIIAEAAAILVSKIDLPQVISLVTHCVSSFRQNQSPSQNGDDNLSQKEKDEQAHAHPNVSVSNAGSVPSQDIDDFE